jgi:LPXTG-motif cell wall-anchored protein
MPTVPLGKSTEGANALADLGFTGIPGAAPPQAINAHLAAVGGAVLKTENLDEKEAKANVDLAAGLPAGMLGGPLVAEQGQVIGFLVPEADSGPPPAAPGRLVDIGAIRDVLSAEGITPRRGPVDTSFEAAMHAFKNGGFAAAIPQFEATLALFPGHAMASANLEEAKKNVGTGAQGSAASGAGNSASSSTGGNTGTWIVVLLALAVLLAVVAMLVLRRRRQASGAGGTTPSPGAPGPRKGQPGPPYRRPTGGREHQAVHSAEAGAGSRAVAVLKGGGSGRGGAAPSSRAGAAPPGSAPPESAPVHGPATAVADGSRRASQSSAAPTPGSSSRRDASFEPAAKDRPAFCTSCGARLGAGHRYCGRCGAAAW